MRNARLIRQKEAKRKAKHKLVGRREPARKHTRTTRKSKTLGKMTIRRKTYSTINLRNMQNGLSNFMLEIICSSKKNYVSKHFS